MSSANFQKKFNFDNVFIREILLGVIGEFYRKVRWTNVWSDKEKLITLPVYYTMSTDERFQIDSYIDDIVGKRPDFNHDVVPRAHVVVEDSQIKKEEYSNPYANMIYYDEKDGIIEKKISKRKVLPIKTTIKFKIVLKKEIDIMKCKESLWEWFFGYKQFNIKHDNMRIDCVVTCPDDYPHEIIRDIDSIGSAARDSIKHIEFNIEVHSYLPVKNHITKPLIANSQNKADIKGRIISLDRKQERNFIGSYKHKR